MMSQAQAESESLSGNVKWGHRRNFKDGKVYYHYASFLGYRKGPDGLPERPPLSAGSSPGTCWARASTRSAGT